MRPYLLFSIIFLVVSVLLTVFSLFPKYQDLVLKKEIISKREYELEMYDEYVKDLKETSQKLKQYQTELSKIKQALPQAPYIPEILSYLQKIAGQAGLLLKDFSFSIFEPGPEIAFPPIEPLPRPAFKEIKIQLSLTGSYESVKNFLSTLEKSARLFGVEKISLSLTKEGLLIFDLSIKAYSY